MPNWNESGNVSEIPQDFNPQKDNILYLGQQLSHFTDVVRWPGQRNIVSILSLT